MIKFEKRKIKMKWKKIKLKYNFNIIWSRIIWFGQTQWDEMIKIKEDFEIWQNLKRKRMKWNVQNNFIKRKFKKWRSEKMDLVKTDYKMSSEQLRFDKNDQNNEKIHHLVDFFIHHLVDYSHLWPATNEDECTIPL